jgi:hypothetical protein
MHRKIYRKALFLTRQNSKENIVIGSGEEKK